MTVAMKDIADYNGKRVIITRNLATPNEAGESAVEIEGTLEAVNEFGAMLKPKGQVKAEIIDADEIEDVRLAPAKDKTIKAKVLKPVVIGQARSHLLERHGFTLKSVNELDEDAAFKKHASIDHVASDLGHTHGEKESASEAGESSSN